MDHKTSRHRLIVLRWTTNHRLYTDLQVQYSSAYKARRHAGCNGGEVLQCSPTLLFSNIENTAVLVMNWSVEQR